MMATAQQATARRDTMTTTMATGDNNNDIDDGSGTTGNEVDNDGDNDD